MTFGEAVEQLQTPVRLWVIWLSIVIFAAPLLLAIFKGHRRDAAIMLGVSLALAISMQWFYGQVGFVRLLGLPHLIFWVPLGIYLIARLRGGAYRGLPLAILAVFLVSIGISLTFDVVDVARYLMGETAPLVTTTRAQ